MNRKFEGFGQATYNGEDTEDGYHTWLKEQYSPELIAKFPPSSVVCFEDNELIEYVVIGYCYSYNTDDENEKATPTVTIIDMKHRECNIEDIPKLTISVCAIHDLPKLKYLYNLNGYKFTEKFK